MRNLFPFYPDRTDQNREGGSDDAYTDDGDHDAVCANITARARRQYKVRCQAAFFLFSQWFNRACGGGRMAFPHSFQPPRSRALSRSIRKRDEKIKCVVTRHPHFSVSNRVSEFQCLCFPNSSADVVLRKRGKYQEGGRKRRERLIDSTRLKGNQVQRLHQHRCQQRMAEWHCSVEFRRRVNCWDRLERSGNAHETLPIVIRNETFILNRAEGERMKSEKKYEWKLKTTERVKEKKGFPLYRRPSISPSFESYRVVGRQEGDWWNRCRCRISSQHQPVQTQPKQTGKVYREFLARAINF